MKRECRHCHRPIPPDKNPGAVYCKTRCAEAARRRRQAGIAEDAYPGRTGRRGRLKLGQPTKLEQLLAQAREEAATEAREEAEIDVLLRLVKERGAERISYEVSQLVGKKEDRRRYDEL